MGGCASKPKDLDNRKIPPPAARKPHAPTQPPQPRNHIPSNVQEKKDGDENVERESVDVYLSARESPKVVMQEPTEAKVETTKEEKAEMVMPEEKKAVAETVAPQAKEKEEVTEIEGPEKEKDLPIMEQDKGSVVPKEEEKGECCTKEDKGSVVPKEDEVAQPVATEEEEKEVAETVVPKEEEEEEEKIESQSSHL